MTIRYHDLEKSITAWIQNYANKYNIQCLVIGVSGGIDSAVASTLTAKTDIPTRVLNMPIHQNTFQKSLADAHLEWLTKRYHNVIPIQTDLTQVFDILIDNLKKQTDPQTANHLHAQANTRSRLRMVTLYHLATAHQGIVVGTGNKIEDYGIGFFTKYGDGGVDIAPIADLYKSEVYALGHLLDIDNRILTTPPTDGLWDDDRTDEDQIGLNYTELETVMKQREKSDMIKNEKAQAIFDHFHHLNLHKIKPIPTFKLNEHGFTR